MFLMKQWGFSSMVITTWHDFNYNIFNRLVPKIQFSKQSIFSTLPQLQKGKILALVATSFDFKSQDKLINDEEGPSFAVKQLR